MISSEVKQILSAPISVLRQATSSERRLFSDKKNGNFYLFGLKSGQCFVVHIPDKERIYTFRPVKNLLPGLKGISWQKTEDVADLGYITICSFATGTSPVLRTTCRDILTPKPDNSPGKPLTKIAFKFYHYHPMLERAYQLQRARLEFEKSKQNMLISKKKLESLMISGRNNHFIQQRKGENQHVRN